MITIRKAAERGITRLPWLDSRHSFSFGAYHDPAHMGFGPLRVINEDRVAPGGGFAAHGHRDMEILSCVLSGALAHEDSLGTGSIIRAGEIQRMSAGTGIRHSEFNASQTEPVHFLQIWIVPRQRGAPPEYEQASLAEQAPRGGQRSDRRLIADPAGGDGLLTVHAPVTILAVNPADTERVRHPLADGRSLWLQVVRGSVVVDGRPLAAGDGAAIEGEPDVEIAGGANGEVLLFEVEHRLRSPETTLDSRNRPPRW